MPQLLNFPAPAAAPSAPATSATSAPPAPASVTPLDAAALAGAAPLPFNLFIGLAQQAPAAEGDAVATDPAAPVVAEEGALPADEAADQAQLPSMADNGVPLQMNFFTAPPAPAVAAAFATAGGTQPATAETKADDSLPLAIEGARSGAAGRDTPAPLASLLRGAGAAAAETASAPAPASRTAANDDAVATLPAAAKGAAILPPLAADSRIDTTSRSAPAAGLPQFASLAPLSAEPQANTPAIRLPGNPDQWQQPLRDALGDRLQLQLQRNSEQATIRLDPPNLGRIDISIRHSAGSLQINLSASNNEVLRQLNAIGDNVRQDLSQRQFADVNVTVSATPRGQQQGYADGGQGRQQGREQQEQRAPGRALSDDEQAAAVFAMTSDRE